MARTPDYIEWSEAVAVHGEVRCEGCPTPVDLSAAETVDDALDIWNAHVKAVHPENYPAGWD